MSTITLQLDNIAQLAYLDLKNHPQIITDVQAILHNIEQLCSEDTSEVTPLFHPLDVQQPLRQDLATEADCSEALAQIAPHFQDGFYLVPKVLDTER